MKLFTVDTIEEAREKILQAMKGKTIGTERVPLHSACGRILAEDISSDENLPAFNRSTVDGYAVRAADTSLASESIPVFLTLTGEVEMGRKSTKPIEQGECVYVPTGGMLPEGADAMVMVEYCECFDETGVAISDSVSPGRNIIFAGEDARAGEIVLSKGTYIRPLEIGVLAEVGVIDPMVYVPFDMTLISIGDELVDPGTVPALGEIRDINTYSISALARKAGCNVINTYMLLDDEMLLKDTIAGAMKNSDIVVVSGGSSQGIKDATARVIDELASRGVLTHGLAIKPGKPTITGYDDVSQTLLIGLPGHPVSAIMVFEMILSWLWDTLTPPRGVPSIEASIDRNLPGAPGKDTLQMVKLTEVNGRYIACPIFGKSGNITRLSIADGYVVIPRNKEGLKAGEAVRVQLL